MANQFGVEWEVKQMSPQQQDQILKIGKTTGIVGGIIIALMTLWMAVGIVLFIMDPLQGMSLGLGIITGGVIGFLCLIAVIVFVKVKYPFYSDEKLKYIKAMRKGKTL